MREREGEMELKLLTRLCVKCVHDFGAEVDNWAVVSYSIVKITFTTANEVLSSSGVYHIKHTIAVPRCLHGSKSVPAEKVL